MVLSFFAFFFLQGNPILGVHLYLYSDDVHKVNCPQGAVYDPWQKSSLCHAVSDANGKFIFSTVPCGNKSFDASIFLRLLKMTGKRMIRMFNHIESLIFLGLLTNPLYCCSATLVDSIVAIF